jgi:hypothetical protein
LLDILNIVTKKVDIIASSLKQKLHKITIITDQELTMKITLFFETQVISFFKQPANLLDSDII